ncbi:nucleotide-binding protein [Flavimobilis sp. GY10621]|uniref:Nucleotide-binding protein n=1 Tax=Flavimobilis rhizosphaerae TaxID=2775421 RepID=A0ABR9DMU4_9MICO|nr:nucleotide-binding protein [Flavimobilis rhizosphaerae]MBD9698446.1 nucleotide-binding protein [Flavimobilis rhizosphaerae]
MTDSSTVFVVHGRNTAARDAMFTFLRALGLKPLEWDQAIELTGKGTPYVGEVLDAAFAAGQAVIVLMTPDDIAYLQTEHASGLGDSETEPRGQARPNVLFEAGMAMGRNPDRTIIVELGDIRPFSDIGGRHVVRLSNDADVRHRLAQRLSTAGCATDTTGSDWLTAGDLTPPPPPGRGLPVGKRVQAVRQPTARVDGRWLSGSGNRFATVKITNTGNEPIFDARLCVPEDLAGVQLWQDDAVAKLPPGKSFTVRGDNGQNNLGGRGPTTFELVVTGRLEDGRDFCQDVYFDAL